MEPEELTQTTEEQHPLTHSYEDDLSHAMNVTDAPIVQELLADARERENMATVMADEHEEQKWYSRSSLLLLFLALAIVGYGAYYYYHLTVKVQPAASVGVFQNSSTVPINSTTLQQVLAQYTAATTLPLNKPTLINLVTDQQSNALLTNSQLYTFIGAAVPEPLQGVITAARLGVVHTTEGIYPFIVASVSDPEKASKEFAIAEPSLMKLFSPALAIDTTVEQNTAGLTFQSQYLYNLPVRIVQSVDATTKTQEVVFLYGYATNNVIVITGHPEALKAVYDSIINQ